MQAFSHALDVVYTAKFIALRAGSCHRYCAPNTLPFLQIFLQRYQHRPLLHDTNSHVRFPIFGRVRKSDVSPAKRRAQAGTKDLVADNFAALTSGDSATTHANTQGLGVEQATSAHWLPRPPAVTDFGRVSSDPDQGQPPARFITNESGVIVLELGYEHGEESTDVGCYQEPLAAGNVVNGGPTQPSPGLGVAQRSLAARVFEAAQPFPEPGQPVQPFRLQSRLSSRLTSRSRSSNQLQLLPAANASVATDTTAEKPLVLGEKLE